MIDPQTAQFLELLSNPSYSVAFLVLIAWNLIIKGMALWRAAHNEQRNWFIALLVINSFGILELVYLFYFGKKKTIV